MPMAASKPLFTCEENEMFGRPRPLFTALVSSTVLALNLFLHGWPVPLYAQEVSPASGPESSFSSGDGGPSIIADPGDDQAVFVGDTVSLDGSASFAGEDRALFFNWSFISKPAPSQAALSDPGAVHPAFIADFAGIYMIELVVSDGVDESAPSAVVIVAELRLITVPVLVGLDLSSAKALLVAEGLKIGPIRSVDDPQTPKNQVRGQHPLAGSLTPENTAVGLVVSFPSGDDDDQDGLPDAWEYAMFGGLQERGAGDADGDGYSNSQEYVVGTDPADKSEAPVPAGTFFEYDMFGRIIVKQVTLEP